MNGLTYIRIRCNVSQSFLAQKLGVTRQAINLWENRTTPPPAKRLKQLTEFFGIDEKYFGEISEEQQHEIDAIPAYRHEENGHTYYCYVEREGSVVFPGLSTLFAVPKELMPAQPIAVFPVGGGDLTSIDERYFLIRQEFRDVLNRIEELPALSRSSEPLGTSDKLVSTRRILSIFQPLDESVRKLVLDDGIKPAHRMLYYYLFFDIMAAIGTLMGTVENADLPQKDPMDMDGKPDAYGMHPSFIQKLAQVLSDELDTRKKMIP